jgi:hypothetical protein
VVSCRASTTPRISTTGACAGRRFQAASDELVGQFDLPGN